MKYITSSHFDRRFEWYHVWASKWQQSTKPFEDDENVSNNIEPKVDQHHYQICAEVRVKYYLRNEYKFVE